MAAHTISEEEASRDFASLMARVRAGEEVVIESHEQPVAVLRPAAPMDGSISATLARMKAIRERNGDDAFRMGSDFADDVEERIRNRKPADRSAWD